MQQQEPQDSQEPQEQPGGAENLEFKPAVKYAAVGLGLLVLFGAEYATYTVGFKNGREEATPSASAQAQAELNARAVDNLTHFMQLSSQSDEILLDTVEHHQECLAWIKDARIRREAEWSLAQALVDRGMAGKAQGLLASLFPTVPTSAVWARRAVCVAEALAAEGKGEDAINYYQIASKQFGSLHMDKERLQVISCQVELLAASGPATQEVMAPLEALQQEAGDLGDTGRALQSSILAYMGALHRRAGDSAAALACFEKALRGMDAEHTPELASAAVCYGMALLEKGEEAKAEAYLRDGVSRLGDDPAGVPYLAAALRELARLETERGKLDEALGLLYRAEGVATGRIPSGNVFWSQLYDQRGWVNFEKKLYESASGDFAKALKDKRHPELLSQPQEGAARCFMALGKPEAAAQHLEEALQLVLKYRPDDKATLGRLYLLKGNVLDMMPSHAPEAVAAYTQAVENLPESSPDHTGAMMSLGYALNQCSRWADAAKVWEGLLPLVKETPAMRDEVRNQLDLCHRHGAGSAQAADATAPADEAGAQSTKSTKPAKRQTSPTRRKR